MIILYCTLNYALLKKYYQVKFSSLAIPHQESVQRALKEKYNSHEKVDSKSKIRVIKKKPRNKGRNNVWKLISSKCKWTDTCCKKIIKNMKIKEEMMKTEKWRTISYKWLVYPDQGSCDWSLFMSAVFVLFTELEINYYYYYYYYK